MINAAETRAIEQDAYENMLQIIREIINMNHGERQNMFRTAMDRHNFIGGFTFDEILNTLSPAEIIDAYNEWKEPDKYGDYRDLTDEEAKDILEWFIHDEFYDKRNTNKGKAIIRGILALKNQIEISKIMNDVLNVPDRKI